MKVTIELRHARVIYILVLCFRQSYCFDYCNAPCKKASGDIFQHTMCLYKTTDPGPACKGYSKKDSVLTQLMKDDILRVHNLYRSDVASGKESRGTKGPQPSAADMMELVWNDEIETIAGRYALQCTFEHDKCRNAENGDYVGQNLGIKAGKNIIDDYVSHTKGFYDEVKDFDGEAIDSFKSSTGPMVGHYTQLVWAKSDKLGCAISRYEDPKSDPAVYGLSELMVCNYQPGGNIIKRPMYLRGRPCSKCPEGARCSIRYPGLCTFGDIGSAATTDPTALMLLFAVLSLLHGFTCGAFVGTE